MTSNYSGMARSHGLLLDTVRQKRPDIPGVIYRMSTSHFYMHLASESGREGRHRVALHWLGRAIRINPITLFMRSGLYVLFIRSVLLMVVQPVLDLHGPNRLLRLTPKIFFREITFSDIKKQRINLKGQLIVQDIFHFVIKKIVRTTT